MSRSMGSIRAFSSSSKRLLPPLFPGSSSSAPSSAKASSSSTITPSERNQAIADLSSLFTKRAAPEEIDRRRHFAARETIVPGRLSHDTIYPERRPPRKHQLFPPSSEITRTLDPFYMTKSKPMDHVMNPSFVLAFMDPLGRVKKRTETGLTLLSQRRVAKMVRRAKAMGIVPTHTNKPSRHGLAYENNQVR